MLSPEWKTSCYHVDFLKFFTSHQYGHPLYSGRCQCLKNRNGVMLSPAEAGDTLWSPLSKPNAGVCWSSYFHLNFLPFFHTVLLFSLQFAFLFFLFCFWYDPPNFTWIFFPFLSFFCFHTVLLFLLEFSLLSFAFTRCNISCITF